MGNIGGKNAQNVAHKGEFDFREIASCQAGQ